MNHLVKQGVTQGPWEAGVKKLPKKNKQERSTSSNTTAGLGPTEFAHFLIGLDALTPVVFRATAT